MSINATKTIQSLPKTISLKIHGQFIYFPPELINNDTINLDYYHYQSNEEFWTDLTSRQRNYILLNLPTQSTPLTTLSNVEEKLKLTIKTLLSHY